MKVCIKRGANQIGGSAVEITANSGERIIVDLGMPLDAEKNTPDLLPDIAGLNPRSDDLLGILISHPHQDHYGLCGHIDPEIPIWAGRAAADIMHASVVFHLPGAVDFKNVSTFSHNTPFQIGPFTITPYLMDHSAYDAYAFVIEADGKRLLYSGDFRAHGRKQKMYQAFVHNPPRDIDVLLMEGSCLGRESCEEYETESELENRFCTAFKQTPGLCMVQSSSQNIDRIVTIYRACKRAGRQLVISGYTGYVLKCLKNDNIPTFKFPDVKRYMTPAEIRGHFKKYNTDKLASHHITSDEITAAPNKYTVFLRHDNFMDLSKTDLMTPDALFIYSMWDGYKEKYQPKFDILKSKNVPLMDIHTSGHADIPTLQKFANSVNPKRLVPIHTFHPDTFSDLFENTELHPDNTTFEI